MSRWSGVLFFLSFPLLFFVFAVPWFGETAQPCLQWPSLGFPLLTPFIIDGSQPRLIWMIGRGGLCCIRISDTAFVLADIKVTEFPLVRLAILDDRMSIASTYLYYLPTGFGIDDALIGIRMMWASDPQLLAAELLDLCLISIQTGLLDSSNCPLTSQQDLSPLLT